MARPVMLSNGQMMVGLNEHGLVHDFYYPFVGLDNLTTARSVHHKIGIWVDGSLSWIDDGTWQITVNFEADALISNISMKNDNLGVEIQFRDFIDPDHNSFVRRLNISNTSPKQKDIRIFMHQVFQISRSGRADTALFVPDINYILDYKGRCALLIYGQDDNGKCFDQYSVGNYGIEGKEGTFKDAEDGELSGNAVEHGGVDSVMRFSYNLQPGESKSLDYWIIATTSQYECEAVHQKYLKAGINSREIALREYWASWLSIGANGLHKIDKKYLELAKKSMLTIKAHTDKRGGILASGDSSIFNYGRDYYCYDWPRDGAYAMWPLIRLGYREEPKRFFEFCRDTLHRNGYLMHKYQPDRAIGSTWHPLVHDNRTELAIQEDETAIVISMIGEYLDYSKDTEFVLSLYSTLIQPAANFMSRYIDDETSLPHASYDLWEEKFLSNTYTAAITAHSLKRAAQIAELFEYPDDAIFWQKSAERILEGFKLLFDPEKQSFRKGLLLQQDGTLNFDNTTDISSLYAMLMYTETKTNSASLIQTAAEVERVLLNTGSIGGVIRYENDWYMRKSENNPPNPWFVCTLWLAQYYIQINQMEKAKGLMDWSIGLAMSSGTFSEQVDPNNGSPVGVAPLVWSHAEFINTALDFAHYE
jgi:GH15 family glucan-1,4-alpha-glucosidase